MIIAIDPGRYKIGIAFSDEKTLLFSAIVPYAQIEMLLDVLKNENWEMLLAFRREGEINTISNRKLCKIIVGNGTSSDEFTKKIHLPYEIADEYGTTLEARKIYFEMHPPCGIKKLIPLSMQVPPRDIDDLAAYAIILKSKKK